MTQFGSLTIFDPYLSFDEAEGILEVAPGQAIQAKVTLPEGLTEAQLAAIQWIGATIVWRQGPNFTGDHLYGKLQGKSRIKLTFPSHLVGGGLAWVEPFGFGNRHAPTNELPNGFFVRSYGNPGIAKTEWREYNEEGNGPLIEADAHYGDYVQLHIYTQDMYGQYLRVKLKDYKAGNAELSLDEDVDDDDNALSEYFTVQVQIYKSADNPKTLVQKAVVTVYLEHRWMRTAASLGSFYTLDVAPIIASDAKGYKTKVSDSTITVKKKSWDDIRPQPGTKAGNKATVIGDVMTDVANFKQCRYETITKTYAPDENSPVTLFSVPEELNVNIKTHHLGVVATNGYSDPLTIKVGDPNFDCYLAEPHDETTLIDASGLEAHFDDLALTESNTKLSFTPKYPYDHIEPVDHLKFLTSYFPMIAAKENEYSIPIETCAFEHEIKLSVYPDVAFSYHIHIGDPEDFTKQNKIYYRNIDLKDKMIRGLDAELDWFEKHSKQFNDVKGLVLAGVLNPIIEDLLVDYIRRSANDLAAGFHGYHTFTSHTEATLVDYSKQYEWLPKLLIAYGVLVSVVIDALILYLTRGRSAIVQGASTAAKARRAYKTFRKIKRYKRTAEAIASGNLIDPARPNGKETKFIWPQVAAHRGIGYVNQKDGRVAVELIERLDAAPLFALEHVVKSSLGSLLADFLGITKLFDRAEQAVGVVGHLKTMGEAYKDVEKANSTSGKESGDNQDEDKDESFNPTDLLRFKDVQKFLDYIEKRLHKKLDSKIKEALGTKAMVELEFTGFYSAHYELRVNLLEKMLYLDIFEGKDTIALVGDKRVTFGRDYGLHASLKLEANALATQKWSKLNHYIPDFLGVELKDTKTDLELEGELSGSIAFERTFEWDVDGKSPTVRDVLIFTGIAGSVSMRLEVDYEDEEILSTEIDSKNKERSNETVVVELLPAFTINFGKEPIFKKSKWEYLIL